MISIIIPSYNSENTICDCLEALQSQKCNEIIEIILVDSSDDSTPRLVTEKFPDVLFIHFNIKTDPGTARNRGIKESYGDLILFIDSDCIAEPDWAQNMISVHRSTDYGAVGGVVKNGNDFRNNTAWAGYMAEFRGFLPSGRSGFVDHIPTCNISYKKSIFEKVGLFNPNYYPQEDLEFNYRLTQVGYQIYLDASIQIAHQHRTELSGFFKHQLKIGEITSSMLKILPLEGSKIARNKLYCILSIWFLPMVKWFRTILIFLRKEPAILFKHPLAAFIFGLGLVPWTAGFIRGVFGNKFAK